ncbi:MAG: signal transduction histidine kinase [Candidatus Omnitrophota bacterium]|jgi:signal transduction histidine kinase
MSSSELDILREQNKTLKGQIADVKWSAERTNRGIKALYTELQLKNEELEKLDGLKTDFISTVSHELRTPLSIIREGVSQVNDGILGDVNANQLKFLGITLENIDRLTRIINDLLDMAKIEAGKANIQKKKINIVHVVDRVKKSFEAQIMKQNLQLVINISDGIRDIYADSDKLQQVLTNLIGNALKFTEQGKIELKIVMDPSKKDFLFSVEDTGKGIRPADLIKVLDKFSQFEREHGPGQKGTGLGMAISKAIVELHGGRIWVESIYGHGSQFYFSIPQLTAKDVFQEAIINTLKHMHDESEPFSVASIALLSEIQYSNIEQGVSDCLLDKIEILANETLRRKDDIALRNGRELLILLPDTDRERAISAVQRVKSCVNAILEKESLEVLTNDKIRIFGTPDDLMLADAIFKNLWP